MWRVKPVNINGFNPLHFSRGEGWYFINGFNPPHFSRGEGWYSINGIYVRKLHCAVRTVWMMK
jgi:hypothetical protein